MQAKEILLLILVVLLLVIVILQLVLAMKKRTIFGPITFILLMIGYLFAVLVTYRGNELEVRDWAQTLLTIALVAVTAVYAWSTDKIAKATKEQAEATRQQAEASMKMADVASRPYIIQTAAYNSAKSGSPPVLDYDLYNAGNGPAIELEISVFDKENKRRSSEKRSFLRGSDSIKSRFDWDLTTYIGSTCYLVSEYQSLHSHDSKKWYQTWLPFMIGQSQGTNEIIVLLGDLEFREVSEKDRIDAFGRMSKPK